MNLHHVSNFSLNLCSTVHYFYPTISSFKLVCLQQLFWTAFSVAVRLKNSPYFCVFKYARAFACSQTKGLERGWKQRARLRACEARALRARTTLTARFTDFFTDFEKKQRLFCSLVAVYCIYFQGLRFEKLGSPISNLTGLMLPA